MFLQLLFCIEIDKTINIYIKTSCCSFRILHFYKYSDLIYIVINIDIAFIEKRDCDMK